MAKYGMQVGLLMAVLLFATAVFAADQEGGTVIRETPVFVSPDATAQRVGIATRGRDIEFVMERSTIAGKPWARVLAKVDVGLVGSKDISGWVDARLLITTSTPNGDQIIYGEAVDSEHQAEERGGRRHAGEDAMRLYYRLYQYFPNSPLAGESLWRAADIRWQLEKQGIFSRPSFKQMSPEDRAQMDDETLKLVIKKFSNTKWADLAHYDLIDNKVCGDWKGEASCPEKESDVYEKYAHEHPQSPKASEALYNAAWRQAALVDIYKGDHHPDKSERARKKGLELAQELAAKSPEGDWKPRAANLIYALQQSLINYGNGNTSSTE
jgi:hypothetical protein